MDTPGTGAPAANLVELLSLRRRPVPDAGGLLI
jgi:hypothetical protein